MKPLMPEAEQREPDELRLDDVAGRRSVETGVMGGDDHRRGRRRRASR
ncbi:MAG: hypothetical protein R2719_05395 [Micropruina sp.]